MLDKPDAIKREMYRTSLDSIRVYNPTNNDFTIVWDGFRHTVPNRDKDVGFGKGQKVMPRYLAMKWCRDMKNKLIGEEAEILVRELIERASEDMKLKYQTDPYEKQKLYDRTPTINDEAGIKRIYDMIWLGVEERYGIEEEEVKSDGMEDQRPIEEQILDSLNRPVKKPAPEVKPEVKSSFPINKAKKKLVEEVSA